MALKTSFPRICVALGISDPAQLLADAEREAEANESFLEFRLDYLPRPEDGLQVTVRGGLSIYDARGEYQLYVTQIEPVGLGALQLAFEQLKKRLEAEGLFAASRKKPAAPGESSR